MSKPVKIYDETLTRNFYSSPLTISDLLGDTYDYTIVSIALNTTAWFLSKIQFNGDAGANYRVYEMKGYSTATASSVADSATSLDFNEAYGSVGLAITKITGSSGQERLVSTYNAGDEGVGTKAVYIRNGYWKNTADEMTSLVISNPYDASTDIRIIIYRTLKEASHDWELISTDTVNQVISASVPYVVSSTLDLDVDEKYRVVIEDANLSVSVLFIRFNSDIGNNYDNQILRNIGSIVSSNVSNYFAVYPTGYNNFKDLDFIVEGDSSDKRLISGQVLRSVTAVQTAFSAWWGNTVDNLTAIQLYSYTTSTFTGHVKLYRKKKKSSDPWNLPFKVIEEVAVSGDFSAGHTFSNLLGDSTALYKIEYLGTGDGGDQFIQFNGDTGDNYSTQFFESTSASTTAQVLRLSKGWTMDTASTVNTYSVYIYTKSGARRPMLTRGARGEVHTSSRAIWWENTADEITSIKVYALSTGSMTGTLRLSRLR